jgi:transcriptional regulator with GAF, ATPase, and Fis domain
MTEILKKSDFQPVRRAYRVEVTGGPDTGVAKTVDDADVQRVFVGTSPACALQLKDPFVSRRHAALSLAGTSLLIEDLDSTNGTFVNGVRVTGAHLFGGETVQVGSTQFRVMETTAREAQGLTEQTRFGRVIGASSVMRKLYPMCERLASSDVPILIEGETGTGKELMAESLHDASKRAEQPFVVFDCSTVATSLLEPLLFGHERGAFTGAVAARKGVFELAHRGTLFIDEIGDLDISLQSRLLRAIERGEVARVGSEKWTKVNVRVIAATRRNLDRLVQEGRFRDDLFFRLAVGRVELPPLRKRVGDVTLLASRFWREVENHPGAMLPPDLMRRFEEHEWPGNVRELRNAVARYHALGEFGPFSHPSDEPAVESTSRRDPDLVTRILEQDLPLSRAKQELARAFEPVYLQRMLDKSGGNIRKAADAAGVARRYFNVLLARHR